VNGRTTYRKALAALVLTLSLVACGVQAQVVITEFMAVNDTTLADEDGNYTDWIELHNAGSAAVDLDGWYLTDNDGNLRKWRFPHVVVDPDDYLVVFASTKDRPNAGSELHTNFKLGGDGEYLALVKPDGLSVASEYRPQYPPQVGDISYGLVYNTIQTTLVATGETCRYLGPADGNLGGTWTESGFDDGGWASGVTGVGYDNSGGGSVLPFIATDVEAAMPGSTLYLRMPFEIESLNDIQSLRFRARYRDGFVVYINGTEVARDRAPETPAWDSQAVEDFTGMDVASFSIANPGSSLVVGTNMLAIHAMNVPGRFVDFLMAPELELSLLSTSLTHAVETYLFSPSPGSANGGGTTELPPRFTGGPPNAPPVAVGGTLVVSQRVDETLYPIDEVRIVYRVMYGAESTLTLNDAGLDGDAAAGDNLYSGTLPLGTMAAGEMVRWRFEAEDDHGQVGQHPLFADPLDSPQYFGTVALDTSIVSRLPVVQWFVENPAAATTPTGTRASLWYLDRFYDNIHANRHGQSTGGFPKKSYNLDFNRGYRFTFREGETPVKDIDFLTNWADKSKCRNTLAYEFYADAGHPCHFAFPIRIQQNAAFFSVADMVEDGDDRYTDRVGLDPDGALYKMYNRCDSSTSGIEKKTRREEDNSDLQALVVGLDKSDANRHVYMYDHVDIPRAVSYLATRPVINDRDHGHKNYYVYRDTDGNGEWLLLHWDVDLCLGHVWTGSEHYYDDTIYTNNEIIYVRNNRFYDAIYDLPETRSMVLRRIRTLMDRFLKPEGTAPENGYFEPRIAELLERIDPEPGESDADRDLAKWGNWGNMDDMRQGCDRIVDEFLPGRRAFLAGLVANGTLPGAQPADAAVAVGRIEFLAASGVQDEEFVELVNTNDYAVDISGWSLDGGISITFNGGTVIAAGQSLFVSPDVTDFRRRATSPTGGESRFVQGDYKGQLSDRGETIELRNDQGVLVNSVTYAGFTNTYAGGLRVSEIMYNPVDGESEFVEIVNTGNDTVDLDGLVLTGGVAFDFANGSIASLAPGEHALVIRSLSAFTNRYGAAAAANVAGVYTGSLNNAGDAVRLADLGGETIVFSCDYNDARGWPLAADGAGHSLVPLVMSDQAGGLLDYGGNWRAGTHLGGSPGKADPAPTQGVVINEVGAHTDTGLDPPYDSDDWIELYNPLPSPVDIGGWYLSDRAEDLVRYQLPPGTTIASNSYLVLTENLYFHTNRQAETGFGINKAGDELFLSHLPGGESNRVVDCVRFKSQLNGVALGRSPDADPFWYALPPTTNAANAAAQERIVISEIMFDPVPFTNGQDNARDEYIELFNATTGNVALANAAGGWRIDGGVSFTFPSNTVLPAGGALLIVSFDPATNPAALAAFKSAHAIAGFEPVALGPYDGKLSNTGERLALEKPQEPDMPGEGVSWVIVDEAIYFDKWPWPGGARSTGRPLQRLPGPGSGNNPANWAVPAVGSPGTGPARIALTLPAYGREFLVPFSTLVHAEVDTYQVSGTVRQVEFFEGPDSLFVDSTTPYECTYATTTNKGTYTFRAELTDDAGLHTSAVTVVSAVGPLAVYNGGASNVTLAAADILGRFEGCDYVDATLFWGVDDGGTNATAWEKSAFVGRVAAAGGTEAGPLSASLDGLPPGQAYQYRWRAVRAGGESWSDADRFSAMSFDAWPHRMRVRFSGYDETSSLTGFPVLVRLNAGISGFDYGGFASGNGADLRFSNADATQRLFHEIEGWATNGESTAWVRVPELAGTNTAVIAYWGNADAVMPAYCTNGAVWSESFKAVWHLNGGVAEAGGNGPAAVDQGTAPVAGIVAGARSFDGAAAYIEPGLSATWYAQNMQGLTVSAWARPEANHDGTVLGASTTSGNFTVSCVYSRFPAWVFGVTSLTENIGLALSQWQYLAMVLDGGQARAARNDGALQTIGNYGEFTPDVAPLLGCLAMENGSPTTFFDGGIDEVRIATEARSETWIQTEYKTVADGFAEYAVLPSLPIDTDGDGLPDEWEILYFGTTAALPGGHGDTDGMSNDDEFTAGTDPTNAASRFVIELVLSNGMPLVRFAARSASGPGYEGRGRYYDLDYLPGLPATGPWRPVPGMSNLPGQDQVVTYPAPLDVQQLYRVRTRLTPLP
jgi:hypothetical protein